MKDQAGKISWETYVGLPTGKRCQYLSKNGRIYDLLFSQQFDRAFLDRMYVLTNKVRLISKTNTGGQWLGKLLSTKKVMLYFVQPSTRTFLSFQTACQTLGLKTTDVRSVETSSEMKGESFEDTIRTFSSYFDMVVMRHTEPGLAERASFVLNNTKRPIPVLNAGSGKDQHPTQALLDIFTLRKSFSEIGGLDNKCIMMVGDLKRGRTVRSLCYLFQHFEGVKVILCSPKKFAMNEDIKSFLKKENIEFLETENFHKHIPDADAIYMTRIQDEYDTENESLDFQREQYTFGPEELKSLKPNAIVMHPLPRRWEIDEKVDSDPRAMYWRQARNGMWTRVALMSFIFGVDQAILDL